MTRPLLALALLILNAAPSPPDETPSALESSPEGWTDLLADPSAWVRGSIPPGGKLSEKSQWTFDSDKHLLVCEGTGGHDWYRYDKEVSDFIYHVEWRFVPVEGKKGYNSGIYARNSKDAKDWIQAQTGDRSGGFLFGEVAVDGKAKRFKPSFQAKESRVKAAGEWNTYEISAQGKKLSLWTNGAVTCEWDDCPKPSGYVGLEAEGYRIEFRNVKLKAL